MIAETHISSIVLQVRPSDVPHIADAVAALGCEIVPTNGAAGRLVLILERRSSRHIVETIDALHAIPGVLGAFLVYHHAEPEDALAQEMEEALP